MTFDEAWDSLFEVPERHADWEEFRLDLALFCAAARATTPPSRIANDGTLVKLTTVNLFDVGADGKIERVMLWIDGTSPLTGE